jgi:hypothetical protein
MKIYEYKSLIKKMRAILIINKENFFQNWFSPRLSK